MRRLPTLLLLLALAPGPPARSAPLPSPRPAVRRLTPSARLSVPAVPDALGGACATDLDAQASAFVEAAMRSNADPLPTPHSTDAGSIAVLEDDGTFFYADKGGNPVLDVAAAARAFYRLHDDDYDFLAIYLATGLNEWLGSPGALAAAWVVRNDVHGIGLSTYSLAPSLGLPSRLQSVLTMNGLGRYPADPDAGIGGPSDSFSTMDVVAHEFGHRWLAYADADSGGAPVSSLLSYDRQHWSFFLDTDASYMYGCEWAPSAADSFTSVAVSSTFGAMDRYLMGAASDVETPTRSKLDDPTGYNPPGVYVNYTSPFTGLGLHARATPWSVANIVAAEGARSPSFATSQKAFRVAFALVVPRGTDATSADLAKLETIRSRFPGTIATATGGRFSIDAALHSLNGSVAILHTPLLDTEAAGTPRVAGIRATLRQKGTPIALDAPSVQLHSRTGSSGAFSASSMFPASADSFFALLPANAGTTVQYWFTAASTTPGITDTLPAAGAAAPFSYRVGPDVTPPVVRHSPLRFQSRDRVPATLLAIATDNLGIDSVWCEYRVNGGGLQKSGAARAGRDSFTVSIGGGVATGGRIAYRFVARDAAAAHNLGYSNVAFDTLHVDHDWYDDFENPSPWFHQSVLWSRLDYWHLETGSSSPGGGTAYHCGNAGGVPYSPHADAALYTTPVYGIVPGTTLSFDHHWDLEQADPSDAFDGARVEISTNNGPWTIASPTPGYTHVMAEGDMPFAPGEPCWSGSHANWTTETIDLSSYSPGPVRVRFRMCSDEFVGGGGWWVDRVTIHFPDDAALDVPLGPVAAALGPAWPNPTRGTLRQSLALPAAAEVSWTLHDVEGRRVATLYEGVLPAGRHDLTGESRHDLPLGVYFARLRVGARTLSSTRIAVVR